MKKSHNSYSNKQIGFELVKTALGNGFYKEALMASKKSPGLTWEELSLLNRFIHGVQSEKDTIALQYFAAKVFFRAD